MLIAFWNVNMGKGSFKDRLRTFDSWCAAYKPDLLLLEEVSHTIGTRLAQMTGMVTLGFANTRDKNLGPTTKQLHALIKKSLFDHYECRAARLTKGAKRLSLKVTKKKDGEFVVWALHANSSYTGGEAAVAAATKYLTRHEGAIVGGDFNYPIVKAGGDAIAPKSWQRINTGYRDLKLTQWNKIDGETNAPDSAIHLVTNPGFGPVIYRKIVPHRVIDYIMIGQKRDATPRPNCLDEETWRGILVNFDHCPVVYDVS